MVNVCILNCDDAKVWNPINFGHMFQKCLCDECDCCTISNVAAERKIPSDLISYQAVVITGSRFNCRDRDNLSWFQPLCEFIREAAVRGTPTIYGGCFGCQIVAFALGGIVDYNPKKNFVLKAEMVEINTDLINKYFPSASVSDKDSNSSAVDAASSESCKSTRTFLNLICSHGDCVLQLPEDSERIGQSPSCANEIFITGPHRSIVCCQSHPEFDIQYCINERIWPSVVEKKKRLTAEEMVEAQATFSSYSDKDAVYFMQIVSKFLKRAGTIAL